MSDFSNYVMVLSEIKYNDDPRKNGCIRCDIPGVVQSNTIDKDALPKAMPWIRPFKMDSYQSFNKPVIGQKVWVMVNKSNYNEFWWMPYHETLGFTQDYLDENYDKNPDIIHARDAAKASTMFTYDDTNGYRMMTGEDFICLRPDRTMEISVNSCRIKVEDNLVKAGGPNEDEYEPCVKYGKCCEMRKLISSNLIPIAEILGKQPYCNPMLEQLIKDISKNISPSEEDDDFKTKYLRVS